LQPLDAARVREWRHRRMLSQQELADRAGTSLFTIQRIERGEGNVRGRTGRGVASALDVSIEDLLPKVQSPLPFEEFREIESGERYDATAERAARYLHAWATYLDGLVDVWVEDTRSITSPAEWDTWCSAHDREVGKLAEALADLPDFAEVAANGDEEEVADRERLSEACARMGRFLQEAVDKAEAVEPTRGVSATLRVIEGGKRKSA
jgi:transcriptional regulator with XRE-family HTH domain